MKILIIEDEWLINSSIKKGLEQENFVVDSALDGRDGYDLAVSNPYDLIILDRMLPSLDGLSICQTLREHHHNTPILMLTARGEISDKVAGLTVGADDYLTKPFSFDELLARVKALLRRPQQIIPSKISYRNLELNLTSHQVTLSGALIQLTLKEYSLLEYLLTHQNQVCTKEAILSHVWDYDSVISDNTIEATIKNLRHKIDTGSESIISTIRGFGYTISSSKK